MEYVVIFRKRGRKEINFERNVGWGRLRVTATLIVKHSAKASGRRGVVVIAVEAWIWIDTSL